MIASLNGLLITKQPTSILLEVGGVGYEVCIPLSTYDRLPGTGAPCRLLVSHVVREDDELLFGFATAEEKQAFNLLLGVGGIGPKTALSVLSGLTVRELKAAIAAGDSKRLSAVHGIGRKTAERLIVELRDKIDPAEALAVKEPAGATPAAAAVLRDSMMGLTALGFAQEQARKMLQGALDAGCPTDDAEALIKRALAGR